MTFEPAVTSGPVPTIRSVFWSAFGGGPAGTLTVGLVAIAEGTLNATVVVGAAVVVEVAVATVVSAPPPLLPRVTSVKITSRTTSVPIT